MYADQFERKTLRLSSRRLRLGAGRKGASNTIKPNAHTVGGRDSQNAAAVENVGGTGDEIQRNAVHWLSTGIKYSICDLIRDVIKHCARS